MSWTDPCGNCGKHRADCDCISGYSSVTARTIPHHKFPPIPTKEERQALIKVVTCNEVHDRIEVQKKNPKWEGFIDHMPSEDRLFMIVTLRNKYRESDFFEEYKYPISEYRPV